MQRNTWYVDAVYGIYGGTYRMTMTLYAPQPLPREHVRPGLGLLVLALHVGLLWLANLYWPLQNVLFATAQSVTVQILQKSVDRLMFAANNNAAFNAAPQAISNPGRQRFGRSEAMLALPASPTEGSTPLAGTVQTALATTPRPVAAAAPVPALPAPPETPPRPSLEPAAQSVTQAVATPERSQPGAVRTFDDKLPEPLAVQPAVVAPLPTPTPTTSPSPTPLPSLAAPATPASIASPAAATASGAALASGAGLAMPGSGSAPPPGLPPAGAGAPLNLNLSPRFIYRPPLALPRRSLSEMANEQLRRKPRDALAEGIEDAGHLDCLKDKPEGPAQGLLAIGPLLKRAIEEKCRK